jgi:hypothetical protein
MSTLYDLLTAAGLPVESARDDGEVVFQRGVSLTEAQWAQYNQIRNDFLGIVPPTEQVFDLPVRAPQITSDGVVQATDFQILTPDIDSDPIKAHKQAKSEFDKGKGAAKSLGTMAMANTFVIDSLLKRIDELEKRIK